MQQTASLEVTYRHGKPLAAYWHLPRRFNDKAERSHRVHGGLVIDYAADGRPIGVEIIAPSRVTTESLNQVLTSLGMEAACDEDLEPLRHAR